MTHARVGRVRAAEECEASVWERGGYEDKIQRVMRPDALRCQQRRGRVLLILRAGWVSGEGGG